MLPTVTGEFRVVADPDLRFAPSGVAVGKVRAVASSRKKNDQDEWVDDKTCWVNITAFKKVAENMAESFEKGDLIVVIGKINTEDWDDKDGNKRTSINIIADFIGPAITFTPARSVKSDRGAGGGGAPKAAAAAPADDPWATNPDDAPF